MITNARSGRRRAEALDDAVRDGLARRGVAADVRLFDDGPGMMAAARSAAASGAPIVVAAGGDGTVSAVAQALAGGAGRLGVIPLGTFNYFARGLGLTDDLDGALDMLAARRDRPWPIGEVNGRVFVNNASIGVYPAILKEREDIYRRWGRSRIAACWSVLTSLARGVRPMRLSLTADGATRRVRTPLVFVANNPYQLRMFDLQDAAAAAERRLAVFIAPDASRAQLSRIAVDLAMGRARQFRDFELIACDALTVAPDRPRLTLARDGERERLSAPLRFRLLPDALRVIAPEQPA
ncbi:MAG: diacylglycerol/lipid kinase family protein [Rubrimonas sp.]